MVRKFLGASGIQVASRVLTMLVGIILARQLGPENFGIYSLLMSIISLSVVPIVAGLPELFMREIAKLKSDGKNEDLNQILSWGLIHVIVSSLAVLILFFLYLLFWGGRYLELLLIILLIIPFRSLINQGSAILVGFKKPLLALVPMGIINPLLILLFLLVIHILDVTLSLVNFVYYVVFSFFCTFLVCGVLVWAKCKRESVVLTYSLDYLSWYKKLLPFFFLSIASILNAELATIMLGIFSTTESIGIYRVAFQGISVLTIGLAMVNSIVGPNIARTYREGNLQDAQKLISKSVRLSVLFSLPLAIVFTLFASEIVSLIYGSDYLNAGEILIILTFGQIVNVLIGSVGLILNMTGNEKHTVKALIISLIVSFVLMLLLIPMYDGLGAAVSVSIGMIIWNIVMLFDVVKYTNLKPWFRITSS